MTTHNDYVATSTCQGILVPVKIKVRERIGCPANCSGNLVERIVGRKCSKCGIYFNLD